MLGRTERIAAGDDVVPERGEGNNVPSSARANISIRFDMRYADVCVYCHHATDCVPKVSNKCHGSL